MLTALGDSSTKWQRIILVLSLLLFFFTIPHTLEDFATGEPGKAGIPAPLLSLVISIIFLVQALGLYGLGQGQRWGTVLQGAIGLFWPLASGLAQLPSILSGTTYRSGTISVLYVVGMIVVGLLLLLSVIIALTRRKSQ